MYHYGCLINDIKEQKNAFQLALNALLSMEKTMDPTDRLFIYPINSEYNVKKFLFFLENFYETLFFVVIIPVTC